MAGPETEAGTISEAEALSLLAIDTAELKALEREGYVKPLRGGRYRTVELVRGFSRWAHETRDHTDTNTLTEVFVYTATARIGQLAKEVGFSTVNGRRGIYNWKDAVKGILRWMKDENRRHHKGAAESRVSEAKVKDLEIRSQERLGNLVPLEVLEDSIDIVVGMYRAELVGLPASFTRDISERRRLEKLINELLKRVANKAYERSLRVDASSGRGKDEAFGAN